MKLYVTIPEQREMITGLQCYLVYEKNVEEKYFDCCSY